MAVKASSCSGDSSTASSSTSQRTISLQGGVVNDPLVSIEVALVGQQRIQRQRVADSFGFADFGWKIVKDRRVTRVRLLALQHHQTDDRQVAGVAVEMHEVVLHCRRHAVDGVLAGRVKVELQQVVADAVVDDVIALHRLRPGSYGCCCRCCWRSRHNRRRCPPVPAGWRRGCRSAIAPCPRRKAQRLRSARPNVRVPSSPS